MYGGAIVSTAVGRVMTRRMVKRMREPKRNTKHLCLFMLCRIYSFYLCRYLCSQGEGEKRKASRYVYVS
jgi:hypothetical protein